MAVQRITQHLLPGKTLLEIEVSMHPDMLIRWSMEEKAESYPSCDRVLFLSHFLKRLCSWFTLCYVFLVLGMQWKWPKKPSRNSQGRSRAIFRSAFSYGSGNTQSCILGNELREMDRNQFESSLQSQKLYMYHLYQFFTRVGGEGWEDSFPLDVIINRTGKINRFQVRKSRERAALYLS